MTDMMKNEARPIQSIISTTCEKIKAFGMDEVSFTLDKNVVSIHYLAKRRCTLQYDELIQLKNIINPEAESYPIPLGYYGEYTFYVRIPA